MRVIVSWSGGKDSCLALYRAVRAGHEPAALLNFVSREYGRCCFHGTDAALMRAQAGLLGIPLVQEEPSADMQAYEEEFKAAVRHLKRELGAAGMVFGDIYLDEHRAWVERVCAELGIQPIEPLWGGRPADIVGEFVRLGFKAVVTSCKADILGREFAGRMVDESFASELARRDICPCGERGEFHTFVTSGPMFAGKIEIRKGVPIPGKGFWESWFLDIQEWEVAAK